MRRRQATTGLYAVAFVGALCAACAHRGLAVSAPEGPRTVVSPQIVSERGDGSARELRARGKRALAEQRWRDAVDAFELLAAARLDEPDAASILLDLGLAYEGLGQRDKALARYREVASRFAAETNARVALVRATALHAYLEDWKGLGEAGERLLARSDLAKVDRMIGLGARALAHVEGGDEAAASHEVLEGLDLIDELHLGSSGPLPVPAAQLEFALAELRRVRSERIAFLPLGPDFLAKMNARSEGLLDAQNAYAEAIRSQDPFWAQLSGFRIGAMYRALHRDLMAIPPPEAADTDEKRKLFFGMMHVRYRVLLDKGIEMMRRTQAFADRTGEASPWAVRARAARIEMEEAVAREREAIAKFPFTEPELERALDLLKERTARPTR